MKRLFVVCLLMIAAVAVYAGTNDYALIAHTPQGDVVFPVTGVLASVLAVLVAIAGSWGAKLAMYFLPAAKPGTKYETFIKYVRSISLATPARHQDGKIAVKPPTDNGIVDRGAVPQTGESVGPGATLIKGQNQRDYEAGYNLAIDGGTLPTVTNSYMATGFVDGSRSKSKGNTQRIGSVTALIIACLFLAGSVQAQTNTISVETPSSNQVVGVQTAPNIDTPTIQKGFQMIFDAATSGNTNWYLAGYAMYAEGLQKKVGGGIGAFYPINTYLVAGTRVDYVNGGFWMPSGSATFQIPLRPIKAFQWLVVTPFTYAGVGVPISGATIAGHALPGHLPKDNNGEATAILGYGGAIGVYAPKSGRYSVELVADRETWSGFPGVQYRGGLLAHIKF